MKSQAGRKVNGCPRDPKGGGQRAGPRVAVPVLAGALLCLVPVGLPGPVLVAGDQAAYFETLGLQYDREGRLLIRHFFQGFVELLATLDASGLLQQSPVKALHQPMALRPADRGGAVGDPLPLQEEFLGVSIGPAAELPAVMAEDGVDAGGMLLKEGQDVLIKPLDGRHRQPGGVEAP